MEQNKEEIQIRLFSSSNEYEISQICAILSENNIPFARNDYGSGSYMNFYMGQSIQEKAIFVHKNDYDKALELMSCFIPNEIEQENIAELDAQDEEEENTKNKYDFIRHSFGFLIFGVAVILPILVMLVSFLLS